MVRTRGGRTRAATKSGSFADTPSCNGTAKALIPEHRSQRPATPSTRGGGPRTEDPATGTYLLLRLFPHGHHGKPGELGTERTDGPAEFAHLL